MAHHEEVDQGTEALLAATFFCGFFGLVGTGYWTHLYSVGADSQFWPTVPATVIEHGAERHEKSGGGSGGSTTTATPRGSVSGSSSTWVSYEPRMTYTYEVDGRQYSSDVIMLAMEEHDTEEQAIRVAESYGGVGDEVTAHYDPDDPSTAVLVVDREEFLLGKLALSVGLLLAGVGSGVAWWRRRKRRRAEAAARGDDR